MVYQNLKESCASLDRRHTEYRFDLLKDIPWNNLNQPGIHFSDRILNEAGINVEALRKIPDAYALFQWSAALELCTAYRSFKTELLEFIDRDASHLGPVRSLLLLYQEQRKHQKLFKHYEDFLRSLQPAQLLAFDKHYSLGLPPKFSRLEESDPALSHFQIWLRSILITEFTIHLANEIQADTTNLHPVWLSLQQAHQIEQQQHLATMSAHIDCIELESSAVEKQSELFWQFVGAFFQHLLPLQVTQILVVENFPELADQLATVDAKETPFYRDIFDHPSLHTTRRLANPETVDVASPPPSDAPSEDHDSNLSLLHGLEYLNPPSPKETLVDRLIATISEGQDRGLVYLLDDGSEMTESYEDLFGRAKNVLDFLRNEGVQKHDAVMIQINRPEKFVAVFWGALLGGMIPVPLASMMTIGRGGNEFTKTARIYDILDHPLIITDPPTKKALDEKMGSLTESSIRVATVDDALAHRSGSDVKLSPSAPNDTAFIQFSSGSTGTPKGVCLSHQNLLHNIVSIIEHQDGKPSNCFVSWLPLFHDMGIIGYHLLPLVLQAKQVLMHPRLFMKRPLAWLQAIDRHKGTCTAAPNFGLNRVIAKISPEKAATLNLEHMHCLLNGSEPISAEIMRGFMNLLEPAKFSPNAMSPGYGLAEGSLCISARPAHTLPEVHHIDRRTLNRKNQVIVSLEPTGHSIPFVEVGTPVPGVSIRIVDDEDRIIQPGIVGHIHVRGPNVTQGYYKDPDLTAASFHNEWLRTGDLGLVLDGRLVVTGRHKDVIFVGGQNFYSHDIEEALVQLEWFETGRVAAFGSTDPNEGRDHICLAGVFKKTDLSIEDQFQETRRHVSEIFGIRLDYIIPVRSNEVPKTSSGKLQRHVLRQRFEDGEFNEKLDGIPLTLMDAEASNSDSPAPQPLPPKAVDDSPKEKPQTSSASTDIETQKKVLTALLTAAWCRILQQPENLISPQTSFTTLGGTSLQAAEVHAEIEDQLGIYVSHEMLNVASTVEEMTAYILGENPDLEISDQQEPLPSPPASIKADPADYTSAFQEERDSRQADTKITVQAPNEPAPPPKSLREQFGPSTSEDATATSLEALVRETWGEILQVPGETIGLEQSFRNLGGSSLQAAEIHATLEDKLGGLISHEMLTESDTVAAMADYISREHPELLEGLSKK